MRLHEFLDMIGCKVKIESMKNGKFIGEIPDMAVEDAGGYVGIQAYGDTIDEIVQGLIDKLKEQKVIGVVVNRHDGNGYKTKYKIPDKLELKAEDKPKEPQPKINDIFICENCGYMSCHQKIGGVSSDGVCYDSIKENILIPPKEDELQNNSKDVEVSRYANLFMPNVLPKVKYIVSDRFSLTVVWK